MNTTPAQPLPREPDDTQTPDSPRFVTLCLLFTAAAAIHGIARLALRLVPRQASPAGAAR